MAGRRLERVAKAGIALIAILLFRSGHVQISAQDVPTDIAPISTLGLSPTQTTALERALRIQDYKMAESILLPEIQEATRTGYKDRLLLVIASIYFLNHDDLNAAIAWKKADSITPLPHPLQFSLAMAYVRLGKLMWAKQQLQKLASVDSHNALYPYWLGRIDYDTHTYNDAIVQFQKAIELDPQMPRSYDNLGLCFFYLNENALALKNFEKAISLDSHSAHPSPWPHINLAATLQMLGRLPEAEIHLREAIRLDPEIASEHFQLGNVLDSLEKPQDAIGEYKQAAQLDSQYAEPHFALARLYRRLGQTELSRQETQLYLELHHSPSSGTAPR